MRVLAGIALSCLLAGGAMAQRRGGGGAIGGRIGGGRIGGGIVGGGRIGGSRIGGFGNGGFGNGGFGTFGRIGGFGTGIRGGFGRSGFRRFGDFDFDDRYRGFGGFYGGFSYWPYYSPSYSYGYWDYSPYVSSYYPYISDYSYFGYGYSPYNYSYPALYQPNVTVVYPETQPTTVYTQRPASPAIREYDQYGQQIKPPTSSGTSSPLYLIAFQDQTIRAAIAYWTDGGTLHYVTPQHEEKTAPLSSVDREMSQRLNRERRTPFQLPQ